MINNINLINAYSCYFQYYNFIMPSIHQLLNHIIPYISLNIQKSPQSHYNHHSPLYICHSKITKQIVIQIKTLISFCLSLFSFQLLYLIKDHLPHFLKIISFCIQIIHLNLNYIKENLIFEIYKTIKQKRGIFKHLYFN